MSGGAVVLLAACLILAPLCAQQAPPLHFRVDTRLVTVPASAFSGSRPIAGLRVENFRVFDDGVEQPISHLDADDSSLVLGLVFDTSASMRRTAPLAPL